ncbi:MAG: hypothetical protein HOP30_08425 [Cyclobacteriaceae bacterium]|nr:hypothetical protein [Cyclobacteriaceae bacterium]
MNRLVEAKYYNTTDPTRNGRFDEKIWNNQANTSGYDLNGNIKFLTRKGKTGVTGGITTYGLMDDMSYAYYGNQLQKVDDSAVDTEGFVEITTGNDYTYDVNGNMVTDQNKGITGNIVYNHLNLPERVTKNTNEYIKYTYDAGGRKLKQEVYNASNVITKTTDYLGEYIYENNVLQFINHEEGRIVKNVASGNYNEYQYNLKDHLGNVRLTFTSKADEVETTTATLETANQTTEQGQFLYYDKARRIYSHIFDRTNGIRTSAPPNNTTPGYAVRLSGIEKEKIGLSRSLSVMPGDVIKIEAYAKYFVADNNYPDFTNFVNSIVAGTAAQGSVIFDGPGYHVPATPVPFSSELNKSGEVGTEPKAYLNWLVFDRDYNVILNKSSYKRVLGGAENGSDVDFYRLAPNEDITITEAGYVYIWLSNENTTPVEVYFDDFKVTQTKSPVVATNDYYPFGLTFNKFLRENSLENRYLYNQGTSEKTFNTERITELDLNVDQSRYRTYDYLTGRWWQVDPLSDLPEQINQSPYQYGWNNPIRYNDPNGDCPCLIPAIPWGIAVLEALFATAAVGTAYIAYDTYDRSNFKSQTLQTHNEGSVLNNRDPKNPNFDTAKKAALIATAVALVSRLIEKNSKFVGLDPREMQNKLSTMNETELQMFIDNGRNALDPHENDLTDRQFFGLINPSLVLSAYTFDIMKDVYSLNRGLTPEQQKAENEEKEKGRQAKQMLNNFSNLQVGTYTWNGSSWMLKE